MVSTRVLAAGLALFVATAAFPVSAAPIQKSVHPHPAMGDGQGTTESDVDVAVRKVLQGYLDALSAGNFKRAAGFWSAAANVKPESLKVAGVTDWFFISSELISATPAAAHVQLNFTVKTAPGANSAYANGRNVRFVHLVKEGGAWKIKSITTSP
ncbi:MAG TPA: hypothetical protein VNT75_21535 [Symbiobacteriaceae bacterium]|nr:hypothetical protein [Symbiobacteriaceae bacterium]